MSTSDWKAELRRRIENIREKKDTEREVRRRGPAVAAAVARVEEHREPVEEPQAESRPFEVVQSREIEEEVPAESDLSDREYESAPAADEEPVPESAIPPQEMAQDPEEAETQEPELETDEPMLFPIQPVVQKRKESKKPVAAVEDRKQLVAKSAAPAASDLEAAYDSYTPLEPHPAAQRAEEEEAAVEKPVVNEPEVPHDLNIRRLLAAAVDTLFLLASEAVIVVVAGALMEREALDILSGSLLPLTLMFGLLHFLYYVIFTSLTGQTPGKILLRLKVVRGKAGEGVGPLRAILRWLALIGSLLPLGAGYYWIYVKPYGCGWHDILTGMRVERY